MTSSTSNSEATFDGKVAIVTGAASGIGLATTELLHARGARVIAVGRSSNVDKLARPGIVPLIADVAYEESAVRAVTLARDTFGKLDVLVNNAGIIINKPVVEMTLDEWPRTKPATSSGLLSWPTAA